MGLGFYWKNKGCPGADAARDKFNDSEEEDYIKDSDIDGVEMILM